MAIFFYFKLALDGFECQPLRLIITFTIIVVNAKCEKITNYLLQWSYLRKCKEYIY